MEAELLRTFLELKNMTKNNSSWNKEMLEDNPPRFLRLRKIEALINFYELGSISDLESFRFVYHKNYDVQQLTDICKEHEEDIFQKELQSLMKTYKETEADENKYSYFYSVLGKEILRIMDAVQKFRNLNNSIYTTSPEYYVPYSLHLKLIDQLTEDALAQAIMRYLINPGGRVADIQTLQRDFDYPEEDLGEVDLDWF
jgi:hypothetical protein